MSEENRFRKRCIRVKLSEEEYEILLQKSIDSDLNISDVVRSLIVYGRVVPDKLDEKSQKTVDELNELQRGMLYELNQCGNNINQIAYYTNSNYYADLESLKKAETEVIHCREIYKEGIEHLKEIINAYNSYT